MIGNLGMGYNFRLVPEVAKEMTGYYNLTWCGKEPEDFVLE